MLINSAQKMPSIERRISMEFRNPAHQLSANILGSYLWRSFGRLIHDRCTREELFDNIKAKMTNAPGKSSLTTLELG